MPNQGKIRKGRNLPRYFKKSIVFVYTVPNIRPLARKIWNVLACLDQKEVICNKTYEISFKELRELIHYKSNDYSCIKSALHELNSETIQSIGSVTEDEIILSEKWLNTTYLESLEVTKGIVRYQYPDLLVPELSKPKYYALLELESLRRLPSSKALIFFEIAGRYVARRKYKGYTSAWSLFYFKTLMGVNSKTYDSYKSLNAKIIKPSLQIINGLTDLEITQISGKYRRVREVQFHVTRKDTPLNSKEEEILIGEMQSIGIKLDRAYQYLKSYGENAVQEALRGTKKSHSKGLLDKTKAAYFVGTLKKISPHVGVNKKRQTHQQSELKKEHDNELVKLRKQMESSKIIQKKIPEMNAFLKTLELNEFQKLRDEYINEVSYCLSEFHDPNNWAGRICISSAHLEHWLNHVEDYKKTTSS